MSGNPWTDDLENSIRVHFASHAARIEDNGNWDKIFVSLTPIQKDLPIKEKKFFSFNPDWRKITRPSFDKLLLKFGNDNEARAEFLTKWQTEEVFISYCWQELKDRDSRNVARTKEKYADFVETDETGEYILYIALRYLAVFATEDEWREAASQAEENPQPVSVEKEQPNDLPKVLKSAVVGIISDSGTDMTKLEDRLNSDQFAAFDIQGDFVKSEVAKMVMARTGDSPEAQEKMLAEINSHFNDDTPYMKPEDIPEIPF